VKLTVRAPIRHVTPVTQIVRQSPEEVAARKRPTACGVTVRVQATGRAEICQVVHPQNTSRKFLRNQVTRLMTIPFVADLATGNVFKDSSSLPRYESMKASA